MTEKVARPICGSCRSRPGERKKLVNLPRGVALVSWRCGICWQRMNRSGFKRQK